MPEQKTETNNVKTCPNCGGTWPADRRHCIACGASLADVPQAEALAPAEPWSWLDHVSQEESESSSITNSEESAERVVQANPFSSLFKALGDLLKSIMPKP